MSEGQKAKIQAVLGTCRRNGRWRVAARSDVWALFGRVLIDMRDAQTDADVLKFSCLSVFGSVTFIVNDNVDVRPSGLAILASQRCAVPAADTTVPPPVIEIDATTVIGKLHVVTARTMPVPKKRWWRRKRRDLLIEREPALAAPQEPSVAITDTASHPDSISTTGVDAIGVDADRRPTRSTEPPGDAIDAPGAASAHRALRPSRPFSPDGPGPASLDEALPSTDTVDPADIAPELREEVPVFADERAEGRDDADETSTATEAEAAEV